MHWVRWLVAVVFLFAVVVLGSCLKFNKLWLHRLRENISEPVNPVKLKRIEIDSAVVWNMLDSLQPRFEIATN